MSITDTNLFVSAVIADDSSNLIEISNQAFEWFIPIIPVQNWIQELSRLSLCFNRMTQIPKIDEIQMLLHDSKISKH